MTRDKNKIILVIILILISLIALVGSSYALLTKSFKSKKLSMQVGTLKIDFADSNIISMTNAAPMTDEDGLKTTPYTFTITNTGDIKAYYTVSNEEELANTLDTSYLRIKLIGDDGYDSGVKTVKDLGTETYRLINETELAVGKTVTYKLYMWISSDAGNNIQDKVYKSKIVVNGTSNSTVSTVAKTLLKGVGDNGTIDASDSEQTFITGTDPNNYIWYSGKLWRAVSIDPSDNSVKLITQWNISTVNSFGLSFSGSNMEQWLNDVTVDGFLGNLREPNKFIKTDSTWNLAVINEEGEKTGTDSFVTDAVGLLNRYEYIKSYGNELEEKGYLNNSLDWWTLTPVSSGIVFVSNGQDTFTRPSSGVGALTFSLGCRPVINLKSDIKISGGTGTSTDPYRLQGDDDTLASGTLLSTRYSGEYISFGTGENNLYRIVSHENGSGTKITSASPLKSSGTYTNFIFSNNPSSIFNNDNMIGLFLNGDYLANNTYLTTDQVNMIENSTTWYLGTVRYGSSYKLAKYQSATSSALTDSTTTAKIGLLRMGELMAGQFDTKTNNTAYWLITPYTSSNIYSATTDGRYSSTVALNDPSGIRPAMNLKSNVVITGGDGTKNNPFTIKLG